MATFNPISYGIIFDDPTQDVPNTVKLNQMVADINAAGYGEIDWSVIGRCALGTVAPFNVPVKWLGGHARVCQLVTNSPTGDVLRFNETVQFINMGMDSTVVRTADNFINLAGTNANISGSVGFVGWRSQVDGVELRRAYIGIKSTGWWNRVNNSTITEMTPKSVAPMGGGIWCADAGLAVTDTIVGNHIGVASGQADWSYRITRGQINKARANCFLTFSGTLVDPGEGDTILIVNEVDCAADNTQETAFSVKPRHPSAIVNYVGLTNSWYKPGWANGAGYAVVFDNAIGATMRKIKLVENHIGTYNPGTGCGLYTNPGVKRQLELLGNANQIGEEDFGFAFGAMFQAGSEKFDFSDNVFSHCTVGVNVAAGCDKYRLVNSFDSCGTDVVDTNPSGPTRIKGPNTIY